MKKVFSVIIAFSIIVCSLCFSSFAADTIRYSVDAKPEGIYRQGEDKLNIKGWAFDSNGTTVTCYYKIDGGTAVATDPVRRLDVQNAFPGQCSQVNCGFDQYISVDNLSYGTHTFLFYVQSGSTTKTLAETTFTVAGLKSDCNTIPSGTYAVEDTQSLNVCGWAFNYSGEETNCYYQIDGDPEVLLERKNRSDVQSAFSDCTQLDCGFNYNIPISEFTIGSHTVTLKAKSGTLTKTIATSEITITSNSANFKYSVDYYLSGTYELGYSEQIYIGGWAYNVNGVQTRCYYQIDSGAQTLITPDNRNDVYSAFSDCTQLDCGFKTYISIADLAKGIHTFKVIAKSGNVSEVIKDTEFTVIGTGGILKSHSDHIPEGTYELGSVSTALVQGWGYNTSAESAKFYGCFDNGTEFYLAGEKRQDVYNSESECYTTDCGYRKEIYLGNLTAGTHTMTVTMKSGDKAKVVGESTFTIIRNEYTVSFNAKGGSGAPSQMTKNFGKNLVLPSTVPTRQYYVFKGWNTAYDESGETIKAGESYKENADTILYAMWEHESIELVDDSELHFDAKENLVYGEALLNISADELKANFKNTNKSVSGSSVGTGTTISFSDNNGVYDTASAVILGDVNADGKVDGMDAVIAATVAGGMLSENQLGAAKTSAADCLHNGEVGADDIEKLINTGILLDSVDQDSVASRGYYDTDFTIPEGQTTQNGITLNGLQTAAQITSDSNGYGVTLDKECGEFNYFGIKYQSDSYVKGTITYKLDNENYSENFFLEPAENGEFCSYIDGVLEGKRSTELVSLSFLPLDSLTFNFSVSGLSVFNRETPETVTYIQNGYIKIGLNLDFGGALSYYEDLDSNVQAVSDNGIIKIDTNASQRYGTEILNDSVNLINCHDTGRLVQQSYYGTENYDMGYFNGHYCAYNPVQGGNMYNDCSKIVDLRVYENEIYIKCRPLDWAKEKEYITDSYMEATYTLNGNLLKTNCRFVDFSGYDPAAKNQELPAFYGAATMDKLVYYSGSEPWTDDTLSTLGGLDEYLYAHYPAVYPTEHWAAFTGDFDDSFSVGLYIPDSKHILAGVYGTISAQTENPDTSDPTSYLAGGKEMVFESFSPIEYDFYISTGTVSEVRNTFKEIQTN